MAQKQGASSTTSGRVGAEIGTATAAADYVLGVGWGATGSVTDVRTGSNDQAGQFTITAAGGSYAQATATVTLTFKDGAYASAPRTVIITNVNAVAIDTGHTSYTCSTTALVITYKVLPAAGTYTFDYLVVA